MINLLNVLIHSTILFSVSSILFFSNEAVKKSQVLNEQIDEVLNEVKKADVGRHSHHPTLSPTESQSHNECLQRWSVGVCLLLGAVTIAYMYINRHRIDFSELWRENLIVLVMIFAFEYFFFREFASRYHTTISAEAEQVLASYFPG